MIPARDRQSVGAAQRGRLRGIRMRESRVGERGNGCAGDSGFRHGHADAHDVEGIVVASRGGTLEAPNGVAGVFVHEDAAFRKGRVFVVAVFRKLVFVRGVRATRSDGSCRRARRPAGAVPRKPGAAARLGEPSEAGGSRNLADARRALAREAETRGARARLAGDGAGGLLRGVECFESREPGERR